MALSAASVCASDTVTVYAFPVSVRVARLLAVSLSVAVTTPEVNAANALASDTVMLASLAVNAPV